MYSSGYTMGRSPSLNRKNRAEKIEYFSTVSNKKDKIF